jgi:hypothetical protein
MGGFVEELTRTGCCWRRAAATAARTSSRAAGISWAYRVGVTAVEGVYLGEQVRGLGCADPLEYLEFVGVYSAAAQTGQGASCQATAISQGLLVTPLQPARDGREMKLCTNEFVPERAAFPLAEIMPRLWRKITEGSTVTTIPTSIEGLIIYTWGARGEQSFYMQ